MKPILTQLLYILGGRLRLLILSPPAPECAVVFVTLGPRGGGARRSQLGDNAGANMFTRQVRPTPTLSTPPLIKTPMILGLILTQVSK